jgi:hypothetical protein
MSCHGGLVAHNIEYDMVSPWKMTGFGRFVRNIMRHIRHDTVATCSRRRWVSRSRR